jgi:hypothetical protein
LIVLVEAIDRADDHAIGVLAIAARFANNANILHGCLRVRKTGGTTDWPPAAMPQGNRRAGGATWPEWDENTLRRGISRSLFTGEK